MKKNKRKVGVFFLLDREYKHENKHRLCYQCDELVRDPKFSLHTLTVAGRGYGSIFDSSHFEVQLCSNCVKADYDLWFNEEPVMHDYVEEYSHEEKIGSLIDGFLVENQEYVWNENSSYMIMDRQDWIDMKLGALPDEKYKEYGMYSPSEVAAYEERFPVCQHPVNVRYDDGSVGCRCPHGAMGHKDQEASLNISVECFGCEFFEQRKTPIREITHEDYDLYKSYYRLKDHMDELKARFDPPEVD